MMRVRIHEGGSEGCKEEQGRFFSTPGNEKAAFRKEPHTFLSTANHQYRGISGRCQGASHVPERFTTCVRNIISESNNPIQHPVHTTNLTQRLSEIHPQGFSLTGYNLRHIQQLTNFVHDPAKTYEVMSARLSWLGHAWFRDTTGILKMLYESHSVEVMVYQYDKFFGYGCWMTSIPTMNHILILCCIFLEYRNI